MALHPECLDLALDRGQQLLPLRELPLDGGALRGEARHEPPLRPLLARERPLAALERRLRRAICSATAASFVATVWAVSIRLIRSVKLVAPTTMSSHCGWSAVYICTSSSCAFRSAFRCRACLREEPAVRGEPGVERLELEARAVVGLGVPPELDVDRLHLREHRLRLRRLRRDLGLRDRRRRRSRARGSHDREDDGREQTEE